MKPEQELTMISRGVRLLLGSAEESGLDAAVLGRSAGITGADLENPDGRVLISKYWDLWKLIVAQNPDPGLGVRFGERGSPREVGIVGYAMLHSRNLAEALGFLEKYSRILAEAFELSLETSRDRTRVVLKGHPGLYTISQHVDYLLTFFLASLRDMTKAEIKPVEVTFPYPRPGEVDAHENFFKCPLRFESDSSSIVLSRADMERSIVAADEMLRAILGKQADVVLRSLRLEDSFQARLQRVLWDQLGSGAPTLEGVATGMGMSSRTLQRRLQREGTTFSDLLDSFRKKMATGLLKDRSLAVYEIAFLLGYSEPSTFFRAFRRWTGSSPLEYRKSWF